MSGSEIDFAIIVTAYEQTVTIPFVIDSLLKLNYSNFLIYIVADKCEISDDLLFEDKRVILLIPEEVLASNTRSHLYAMNHFLRMHDKVTIIDSDNLVDREYLNELSSLFNQGYLAVQGIRKAKNLNTDIAALDAARDIYYHFYDGKLLFEVGSSATLSGSGMAFEYSLYRRFLSDNEVIGAGFDKVLQAFLVKGGNRIAFCENAIVYDEKTMVSTQLIQQRSRWINTWFKYFKLGFEITSLGITNWDRNQFVFGLVLLRPPLFIFIILSLICMFVNLFVSLVGFIFWVSGFTIFVVGFYLSLKYSLADKVIYRSLIKIPKFMVLQILSLIKSRNANRRSVATIHYFDKSVDDIQR